jgi:HSP20 family protein
MSLINFVPFLMDDMKLMKPLTSLNYNESPESLASVSSDFEEDENTLRFYIDVPGCKATDLDVTIDHGHLYVSGSRRTHSMGGKTTKRARFSRSFSLDEEVVDVSKMEATLEDGVLTIIVSKKPKSKPVKIPVKVTHNKVEKVEGKGDKETDTEKKA